MKALSDSGILDDGNQQGTVVMFVIDTHLHVHVLCSLVHMHIITIPGPVKSTETRQKRKPVISLHYYKRMLITFTGYC